MESRGVLCSTQVQNGSSSLSVQNGLPSLSVQNGLPSLSAQNGLPSLSVHPYPRGSYEPLPHIHRGNGLGPSWPGDLPPYSSVPGDSGVPPPVSSLEYMADPLSSLNSRGTSTARDCWNWVERSSQVMQVFPPQRISVSPVIRPAPSDSPPLPPAIPPNLPPPLPCKVRDLIPRDSPPPAPEPPPPPLPEPPSPSPPLVRSGMARVSFREPISCSYSVEEDEEDEEEEEEEEEEEREDREEDGADDDETEEGFGRRLHLQKGIPPQMDLLDGSCYHQRNLRRGWGHYRVASDSPLQLGTERRFRRSRPDHPDRPDRSDRPDRPPRLDTLGWRGDRDKDRDRDRDRNSLAPQPTRRKHDECCSTCSSSSDSEEEGFFLGQPIPLPPQLRPQDPRDSPDSKEAERNGDGEREAERDWGLRGSIRRRRRAHSLGAKDKDKNCAIS